MENWLNCDTNIFWGEIAPTDHVLQIYENEDAFMNLLMGFVSSGIKNHECVVIIGTALHVSALKTALKRQGFNLNELKSDKQLILLDAEDVLANFMVNDWPDEDLFHKKIGEIVGEAHKRNRRIRAFGEMVAVLWAKGLSGATVQLEDLWNKFCENKALCLFCAYPKIGFTQDMHASMNHICHAHTKMISGEHVTPSEVFYRIA